MWLENLLGLFAYCFVGVHVAEVLLCFDLCLLCMLMFVCAVYNSQARGCTETNHFEQPARLLPDN